jgi:sodium transport system permease protein
VLLSILAFAAVGHFLPTEKIGMSLEIGMPFVLKVLFVMLPLAALLAALQTLVSAFAKSYREAQTYLSLLVFVPVIPTMLLTLLPVKVQTWMYALPLMSQQVIITRLLRGEFVSNAGLAICFVCTALAALIFGVITERIYRSERLAISA